MLTQLPGPPQRVPPLQVELGSSLGGPYLAVHLRRKDFIWGHREDVPSLEGAVKKIRSLMKKHGLDRVFVATDAVRKGRPPSPALCLARLACMLTLGCAAGGAT